LEVQWGKLETDVAGTERFEDLGRALDQAARKGHLPDPGQVIDQAQDNNLANTRAYILTLSARLIDLGYIRDTPRNRTKETMDPYLKNAVKKFQKEAGLKPDKWAGPRTWKALQQLVSFENEQNPGDWEIASKTAGGIGSPAVLRAVYLRLYVLGFFDWQDKLTLKTDISPVTNVRFHKALDDFLDTARRLNITRERLLPEISLATLGPLFSQDGLIRGIAAHPGFVGESANKVFLEAIARIELWLVGFGVNVGNPRIRLKKRRDSKKSKKRLTIAQALEAFWKHQPIKKRPKKAVRKIVSPAFFNYLVQLESEEDLKEETMDKDLVDQVCRFSPGQRQALMTKLKQVATSIWDGIKRVIRWIRQGIRHLFSKASSSLKNMARFIAQRARCHFEPVRKAFDIVHRGVVFLRNKVFPGSRPDQIIIYHDRDFDIRLLGNPLGNPGICTRILGSLELESLCFGAACRILGHLAAIFRRVGLHLVAGVAWFAVLLSLTRLGKHLAAIKREVDQVRSFEVDPDQSPFSNPVI
jgi:hypothetical protein